MTRKDPNSSALESITSLGSVMAGEAPGKEDRSRIRLLDAAHEQFCKVGIQRTSMEDVARSANLSRITVYRKFATKDSLVEQVVLREFRTYFEQFLVDIELAETVDDRIVLGFVSSLRAISNNALISALIDAGPHVHGSIVGDNGRTLAMVRQFVASQLRREQGAGTIADEVDVDLVAEMFVRVTASFLMIPSEAVNLHDDAQMEALARQFLVPMIKTQCSEEGH
ncbi:UNVERIFIED_ORG: TetR family transcriptional regulator [Nocardia globerula]|uniref:TetR family transcriptional regulator n=2 Tax=Nocardiaceae TaxID=85025 RepID=A0A652YRL8_NOCGL|nr:TetR family transcriptional regulator [Rhodococcus globerulus]